MADAGQVGGGGAPSDGSFKCNCSRETWPSILFVLAMAGCILTCICSVTDLVGGATANLILDVYVFIFGIIGVAAELRIFQSIRGIMFFVIKHVYFMARPCGRGVFYLFMASLTWTAEFQILPWVTAIGMAVVAVAIILVDLIVGLPVFTDKEVQQTLNQAVRGAATDIAIDQAKKEASASTGGRI